MYTAVFFNIPFRVEQTANSIRANEIFFFFCLCIHKHCIVSTVHFEVGNTCCFLKEHNTQCICTVHFRTQFDQLLFKQYSSYEMSNLLLGRRRLRNIVTLNATVQYIQGILC